MALDGGFLKKIVDELKTAIDCHIDKIYQPSRDELVIRQKLSKLPLRSSVNASYLLLLLVFHQLAVL